MSFQGQRDWNGGELKINNEEESQAQSEWIETTNSYVVFCMQSWFRDSCLDDVGDHRGCG